MDSKEVAITRKPALARGSWTGNPAVVERNHRRAARLQAARPSNAANAYPAPVPYGPILGCCAYATFVGDGAEYACAARVWAQSVLETGTAHPVVIVATTHMHGGLGNLSGQVRLAHYPPAPSLGKHNFAVTFGKLWAGQLPYARVVYVDADTLLLRSLDHLFALGPTVGRTPTLALSLSLALSPSRSLSRPLSLPLGGPQRAARLLACAALLPERGADAHQHEQARPVATTPYHPCCPVATTPAALTTCPFQHAGTFPGYHPFQHEQRALQRRPAPPAASALRGRDGLAQRGLRPLAALRMGRRRRRVPHANPSASYHPLYAHGTPSPASTKA